MAFGEGEFTLLVYFEDFCWKFGSVTFSGGKAKDYSDILLKLF